LSISKLKDDFLLSRFRVLHLGSIFFGVGTIFYSFTLIGVFRKSFLNGSDISNSLRLFCVCIAGKGLRFFFPFLQLSIFWSLYFLGFRFVFLGWRSCFR
jgi:hypothetical protein